MELLAAAPAAWAHAPERTPARRMDAGRSARMHEAAAGARAAQSRERQRLPGQSGREQHRERRAADTMMGTAHGLTRASAIGLASFAGVKVKVSAANVAFVVQDSVAS